MFSKKGKDADGFLGALIGAITPDLNMLSGLPVNRAMGKVVRPRGGARRGARRGGRRGGGWSLVSAGEREGRPCLRAFRLCDEKAGGSGEVRLMG